MVRGGIIRDVRVRPPRRIKLAILGISITVPLQRQNLPLEPELTDAFLRVLHSGRFILGPEVERFEAAAALADARYAVGISSGTDAILVALPAVGIGPDISTGLRRCRCLTASR
jgi:hypothetical protein